jgi:NADH-quinone oxidoreductase subunit M
MPDSNLIPILLLVTIAGAIVTLLATPKGNQRAAGPLALVCSLVPLAIVLYMLGQFPNLSANNGSGAGDGWYYNFDFPAWMPQLGLQFTMGMDTISLWLVLLTAILTPISILASFNYIKERQREFYAWLLALHAGMLGVFCAKDILVFYLFFEFTLIPMFFIIGIWGGQNRRAAANKFFLFTFAGSVLTLVSLVYLAYVYNHGYIENGHIYVPAGHYWSFQLADLQKVGAALPAHVQAIVFLGLMAGFAVKVPLFPVHTWLPLAHTEAPTAGSVILAGVLLKLGTYGMLRFAVPLLPEATLRFAPAIAVICIIGIIYGALVSWAQGDMKKLIAYSSVSHLAFCVLGMFALTKEGLTGSILYMLNHGLSTGALFLVVGMIYERYHTRDMDQVGGIVRRCPALGFFCIFFVFSSVALPGLNGFISEFTVLLGTFVSGKTAVDGTRFGGNLGPAYAVPAATGVILGAVYLLYWAGRVVFGPLKEPAHDTGHHEEDTGTAKGHHAISDLSLREWAVLVPMAAMIIYMGVYPKLVVNSLQPPVATLNGIFTNNARVAEAQATPTAIAAETGTPTPATPAH